MQRNDLLLIYPPRLFKPPFPRPSPQGTPDGRALLAGISEVRGQLQLSVSSGRESQRPCQNPHLTTACRRRLTASARASLPLPAAPDAQR
jgi:hypothetical protein